MEAISALPGLRAEIGPEPATLNNVSTTIITNITYFRNYSSYLHLIIYFVNQFASASRVFVDKWECS